MSRDSHYNDMFCDSIIRAKGWENGPLGLVITRWSDNSRWRHRIYRIKIQWEGMGHWEILDPENPEPYEKIGHRAKWDHLKPRTALQRLYRSKARRARIYYDALFRRAARLHSLRIGADSSPNLIQFWETMVRRSRKKLIAALEYQKSPYKNQNDLSVRS